MKIEHMREFLELAAAKNYSVAARNLFISQPTLSRHIQAMEEELGYPLVETTSHHVSLTEYGYSAVRSFRKILKEYDVLIEAGKNLAQRISGTLTLGILYYAIDDYCSGFLQWFQKKYPNIQLKCNSYLPQQLVNDLLALKIDVGTLFCVDFSSPNGMNYFKVSSTSMIAMTSKDSPLARKSSVTLEELKDYPLITLENDEYSTSLTEQYLQANHIHFHNTVRTDNVETVPWTIRSTGGVHITGESVRRQNSSSAAYIPISSRNPGMSFGFVCVRENDNPLVTLFFEALKEFFHFYSVI